MTHPTTDLDTDRPAPLPTARRPYTPPALSALGAIGTVTAGPDGTKTLDGLVGDDGGFAAADDMDPTS